MQADTFQGATSLLSQAVQAAGKYFSNASQKQFGGKKYPKIWGMGRSEAAQTEEPNPITKTEGAQF